MPDQDVAAILKKVRRIQIVANRTVNDLFAGQYKSVFRGRGMEFDEVREYQPGDDIRTHRLERHRPLRHALHQAVLRGAGADDAVRRSMPAPRGPSAPGSDRSWTWWWKWRRC